MIPSAESEQPKNTTTDIDTASGGPEQQPAADSGSAMPPVDDLPLPPLKRQYTRFDVSSDATMGNKTVVEFEPYRHCVSLLKFTYYAQLKCDRSHKKR